MASAPMEMSFRETRKGEKGGLWEKTHLNYTADCVACGGGGGGETMFKADTVWNKQQIRQKTK